MRQGLSWLTILIAEVLAVRGGERFDTAAQGDVGETVRVACMNMGESNWIPSMVLHKGKYRREKL
jgi:hypothetical protein